MSIQIIKSEDRGKAEHGWLSSRHTFSFADYYNPNQMGFRVLRVINEDWVQPAKGFGTHPHRDMEIITFVISGELQHKDSMGNGSVIRPGDIQYMSAGSGVTHSEFNPSSTEVVHLLQIWIQTNQKNAEPKYSQIHYKTQDRVGEWRLLVSPTGEANSIAIRQDAKVFVRDLNLGESATYSLKKNRFAWIQMVSGECSLNDKIIKVGDGVSISDETKISIEAISASQILLFDLP